MSEICARELRATLLGNQSDWKPTHETTYQHTRRRCDGRRMVRRARASFEIDHSESSASRVAISRTAGPDGAQKTSGATSTNTPLERREGRAAADTTARGRTRYGAQHPLRGTTPRTRHHTRYEALHPLRGTTPDQKRCTAYGSGAHPITRTNAESARRRPTQRGGRCTRYGARHPIRRGALPTDRVHTQSQEQTRNLRDNHRHNSARAHPL